MKICLIILTFTMSAMALNFWPLSVNNEWIFTTDYDGYFLSFRIVAKDSVMPKYEVLLKIMSSNIQHLPVVNLHPLFSWIEDSIGIFEVHEYSTKQLLRANFSLSENDSVFSESTKTWIKLISKDTTIQSQIGSFQHCILFSDSSCYAPNVGPLRFRFRFEINNSKITYSSYFGNIHNLIYARIDGMQYGTYPSGLTSVEIVKEHPPNNFTLLQNHPNPFNSTTVINFNLPEPAEIKLTVFDVTGNEVKTILNSRLLAGTHSARWDGTDNYGRNVASGLYFIRLQTGQASQTIKAVYTR